MLPTLRAFGRAEIRATCPNGHRVPKSLGMVRDLHIPLAGGPSSGKSSLAAGAFVELATVGREAGLGVELAGEDARKFARVIRGLATGTEPAKTIQQRQPALLARLRRPGRKRDVFLFAYDVAGELYADADRVRAAQSLDYISGAVLVVDPGSVPALAREKRAEIAAQAGLKVSTEEPADVYSRLVNALRERGVDIGRLRLAVVLTKVDALDVREDLERIDDGVEALATAPARAWLELHGQDALVGRAEQDFKEVGFFAASALGRSPDASGLPFEPQGALEPIRWIMSRNGFQIPQLQGPVDEEVDLGVSQDFAGGTVHHTRSRGARHTRARDRAPRPAMELSRINVLAHLPYAVVLGVLLFGGFRGGLFDGPLGRDQPVQAAAGDRAGQPTLLEVDGPTSYESARQVRRKGGFRVDGGTHAELKVLRGRTPSSRRPRLKIIVGEGDEAIVKELDLRRAQVAYVKTLAAGRYRLRSIGPRRIVVTLTRYEGPAPAP